MSLKTIALLLVAAALAACDAAPEPTAQEIQASFQAKGKELRMKAQARGIGRMHNEGLAEFVDEFRRVVHRQKGMPTFDEAVAIGQRTCRAYLTRKQIPTAACDSIGLKPRHTVRARIQATAARRTAFEYYAAELENLPLVHNTSDEIAAAGDQILGQAAYYLTDPEQIETLAGAADVAVASFDFWQANTVTADSAVVPICYPYCDEPPECDDPNYCDSGLRPNFNAAMAYQFRRTAAADVAGAIGGGIIWRIVKSTLPSALIGGAIAGSAADCVMQLFGY
jgi:hypothetical protein